jgi:hypothetical protein
VSERVSLLRFLVGGEQRIENANSISGKAPKIICFWAAISRKSHPYRISYLRAAERKGFWATRRRGREVGALLSVMFRFILCGLTVVL